MEQGAGPIILRFVSEVQKVGARAGRVAQELVFPLFSSSPEARLLQL